MDSPRAEEWEMGRGPLCKCGKHRARMPISTHISCPFRRCECYTCHLAEEHRRVLRKGEALRRAQLDDLEMDRQMTGERRAELKRRAEMYLAVERLAEMHLDDQGRRDDGPNPLQERPVWERTPTDFKHYTKGKIFHVLPSLEM